MTIGGRSAGKALFADQASPPSKSNLLGHNPHGCTAFRTSSDPEEDLCSQAGESSRKAFTINKLNKGGNSPSVRQKFRGFSRRCVSKCRSWLPRKSLRSNRERRTPQTPVARCARLASELDAALEAGRVSRPVYEAIRGTRPGLAEKTGAAGPRPLQRQDCIRAFV